MILHDINPIFLKLGPFSVYWYSVMYIIAFNIGILLAYYRTRKQNLNWTRDELDTLAIFFILGVILGGKIGDLVLYRPQDLIANPIIILRTFFFAMPGASFYGGLVGVLIALRYCSYSLNKKFLVITDFIAPFVPPGIAAGRIGNFINGELWGRPSTLSWSMVFPRADFVLRHPSQLYEFALEGIVLFIVVWYFSRKPRPVGAVSGLFAVGYSSFRSFLEFFREPHDIIGFITNQYFTMGQLLSSFFLLTGIFILIKAYKGTRIPHPLDNNFEV